jgi:hypothetical protein
LAVVNETRTALLQGQEVIYVEITGGGTVYGNAEHYIHHYEDHDKRFEPSQPDGKRPKLLLLNESSHVHIRNLSFQNSSDWNVHIRNSEYVTVDHCNVTGDRRFPNNDGIDPDSSRHVTISHCYIDVADDGICLKAHDRERPLQHVTVTHCTIRSRSHAIKFGSDTNANMSHVLFQNITIRDSNSGVALQQRGPGNISNVTFRGVRVAATRYDNPRWWGNGEWLCITSEPRRRGDAVGRADDLVFENVTAVSENGGLVSGRAHGVTNLTMKHIRITIKAFSNYSDGSGPPCSFLQRGGYNNAMIVPIQCMGTRDYRPSYWQGDDPFCISRGACRTPAVANGMYFENVRFGALEDVTVVFDGPRRLWYGDCIAQDNRSYGIIQRGVKCLNGPTRAESGLTRLH